MALLSCLILNFIVMGLLDGFFGLIGAPLQGAISSNLMDKQYAMNKNLMKLQENYNMQMYNRQFHDSSPAVQAGRLRVAGFNPNVMASGSGSVGSSVPSALSLNTPSVSAAQVPDIQGPLSSMGSVLDDILSIENSRSERSLKDASAEQVRIENQYKALETLVGIEKMISETKDVDQKRRLNTIQERFMGNLLQADLDNKQADTRAKNAQANLTITQDLISSKNLSFLDQRNKLELANLAYDLYVKIQTGELTKKQAEHEIQKIAETKARTSLIKSQDKQVQVQTGTMKQQYNFDKDTYENRVKLVSEELKHAINNSSPDNLFQTILGVPRALRRAFGGD